MEPTVISYSATISACEEVKQWGKVLKLLEGMRQSGLEPFVITCSTTISACEKAKHSYNAVDVA